MPDDAVDLPPELPAERLSAPFPYFGGKASAAAIVWQALGDVPSYVEPFVGSAAVLLARPVDHRPVRETVNDADGFISNFWRAIAADSAAVAHHADWPVSERDLEARHYWLVTEGAARLKPLAGDPAAFDAQVAGWWVWGACAWIGSGWCSSRGPWQWADGAWQRLDAGRGINRQLPHLGNAGQGINRQVASPVADWFAALSARLRRVVMCCGDWSRVVASDTVLALNHLPSAGVFLDPPYGAGRMAGLYGHDDASLPAVVRAWCAERGADPRIRIVLAGYADDGHAELVARHGWREISTIPKRNGSGYGNRTGAAGSGANRQKERLYLSPACHDPDQRTLF